MKLLLQKEDLFKIKSLSTPSDNPNKSETYLKMHYLSKIEILSNLESFENKAIARKTI